MVAYPIESRLGINANPTLRWLTAGESVAAIGEHEHVATESFVEDRG